MKRIKIIIHKLLYPVLLLMFRTFKAHNIIFYNEMPQLDENAIFAVNHSCKYDIPYTCEVVKRSSYVLIGKQPLEFIDRIAFWLNGTVWVDRKNRNDKKKATAKMIELLKKGANLVMFPEGTWNLTPSNPMLPLYWGVIDIARKSGRPIVPMILEYTDENCYVAFGQPMFISEKDDKGEKIRDLDDRFATLKWLVWEKYSDTGYNSAEEWETEARRRVADYPKLDYRYEKSVIRKEYISADEVFCHLKNIEPKLNNSHLFNKRNHD